MASKEIKRKSSDKKRIQANKPDKSKPDETKHEEKTPKSEKIRPLTRVVIRKLPPTMTEEILLKHLDPLPDYDFFYFAPADWSLGQYASCRAYINFVNQDDIYLFKKRFDGYVFIDKNGTEYPVIVEFAPFQGLYKSRCKKKDSKCGTIGKHKFYTKFVDRQNEVKPVTSRLELYLQEKQDNKTYTTPLLEYLSIKKREQEEAKKQKLEQKKRRREEGRRWKKMQQQAKNATKGNKEGDNKAKNRNENAKRNDTKLASKSDKGKTDYGKKGNNQKSEKGNQKKKQDYDRSKDYQGERNNQNKNKNNKNNNNQQFRQDEKKSEKKGYQKTRYEKRNKPVETPLNESKNIKIMKKEGQKNRSNRGGRNLSNNRNTENKNNKPENAQKYNRDATKKCKVKEINKNVKDSIVNESQSLKDDNHSKSSGNHNRGANNHRRGSNSQRRGSNNHRRGSGYRSRSSSSVTEKGTMPKERVDVKQVGNRVNKSNSDKKDNRTANRIKNKDRPSMEIYQPGKMRLQYRREGSTRTHFDSKQQANENSNRNNEENTVTRKVPRYSERRLLHRQECERLGLKLGSFSFKSENTKSQESQNPPQESQNSPPKLQNPSPELQNPSEELQNPSQESELELK